MNVAIIGNGGLAREVKQYLRVMGIFPTTFVSDEFYDGTIDTLKLSEFDASVYNPLICIADPFAKKRIVESLPIDTKYFTFIHPSAQIYTHHPIGTGSIICPNVVMTTDVKIGSHVLLNYNTTIGHDTYIGDYSTINPNSAISGNCNIQKNVFVGSKSAIREKTFIVSGTIIGMGSVVVKNIEKSGTYVGVPSKEIVYG